MRNGVRRRGGSADVLHLIPVEVKVVIEFGRPVVTLEAVDRIDHLAQELLVLRREFWKHGLCELILLCHLFPSTILRH